MNVMMTIDGMIYDLLQMKCKGGVCALHWCEKVNIMLNLIENNSKELMGKELYVRKLINLLVSIKDNKQTQPLTKQNIDTVINTLFHILDETRAEAWAKFKSGQ